MDNSDHRNPEVENNSSGTQTGDKANPQTNPSDNGKIDGSSNTGNPVSDSNDGGTSGINQATEGEGARANPPNGGESDLTAPSFAPGKAPIPEENPEANEALSSDANGSSPDEFGFEEKPDKPMVFSQSGIEDSQQRSDNISDTKPGSSYADTHPVPGVPPIRPPSAWRPVEDSSGTRVTPSAFGVPTSNNHYNSPPRGGGGGRGRPPSQPQPNTPRQRGGDEGMTIWGCLLRILIGALFLVIILSIVITSIMIAQYYSLVNSPQFPDVNNLREHASQFETTTILDRNDNPLYEMLDPSAGRRTYVDLKPGVISPYLIAATIATEDREYYNHRGFDPVAIIRALLQNAISGEVVSGASTITQQLARVLLLSPEERGEKTVQRKALEIVLAAEITRIYSKEEILELYINQIYYGNLAYGIEAAAQTYFHTSASKLTLAQSAFLAGLPQAPGVYDIFQNRKGTLERFDQVLVLLYETSRDKNCIYVSTNIEKVCVSEVDVARAMEEIRTYSFELDPNIMRYPHWITYIQSLLRDQFGYTNQMIYSSGMTVHTTLDPILQDAAQQYVTDQVRGLADRNVKNGALVAIKPSTGEILAMVGSPDYNEPQTGQINMAVLPRQPGSAMKPLTYTAAFEKGWTPATLIWDIPTGFPPSGDPGDTRPPYEPKNYDGEFHGPVTVRTALANSYNIPAVKTLQFVGIYDNPDTPGEDGFIAFTRRMGISTLTRPDYGLSLTLGGGEVSLLELTGAYSVYANGGWRIPPMAITKIVNFRNEVLFENIPPEPYQAVQSRHAYLISSILSDNEARAAEFGTNSVLNLPFPAAVKTGTSNDFRDNWTLGYTPDIAVGVWVGNADNTPMQNTTGVTGAAPIWANYMRFAANTMTGGFPSAFVKPNDVIERTICVASGSEPSEWCPSQRLEVFAADQPPLPKENDFWRNVDIDTWTGLLMSNDCNEFVRKEFVLNVSDPQPVNWIKNTEQGRQWAASIRFGDHLPFVPIRACRADDPRPTVRFEGVLDEQTVAYSPLDIYGVVDATSGFKDFVLQYGFGDDPQQWLQLGDRVSQQVKYTDMLYVWFLDGSQNGRVTLRLYLSGSDDHYAEKRIHLNLLAPTATPTVTPTITPTVTPSHTPLPTGTPLPTFTMGP